MNLSQKSLWRGRSIALSSSFVLPSIEAYSYKIYFNPYWQGFGVWPSVFWGKKFRILISPKLWRHYRTWVGHAMLHGYLVGGCTTTQNDVSQWRHVTKISASKVDYPSNRGVWPSVFPGKKYRKTFYAILSILGFDPACFREKKNRKLDSYKILKICEIWGLTQRVFGKKIPHVGIFFLKTRWVKPQKSKK